jgi:uncharacterized membrane protein (DUF4010 family)
MPENITPVLEAGRLGLALAMAVFMGLAFEGIYKRDQHGSPGGIRTFPMLATLGALLFLLDPHSLVPFIAGLLAVALWMFGHIRLAANVAGELPSLMIPTANLLAFTLGPAALTQPPWIVVAATVAAVVLLESRDTLHHWVQEVAPYEVLTLGKFLILVGIILPLVPDHRVVAWTPITPLQVWMALVAISSLSYASYLLQRYVPLRAGALLPAMLGGIYSSTATTVTLARRQKDAGGTRPDIAVGIVIASAMMYLRIDVIVAIFNASLALLLLPVLVGLFATGAAVAAWQWWRRPRLQPEPADTLTAVNPLQLSTAVSFALLFVIVALASNWVRSSFGERGVYVLAALIGVTDVNPFVLSVAQGGVGGMSNAALGSAILIAVGSNNIVNAGYALLFGGIRACLRPASILGGLGALALLAALLYGRS